MLISSEQRKQTCLIESVCSYLHLPYDVKFDHKMIW